MSKPLNYPESLPGGTLGMSTKDTMEHYRLEHRRYVLEKAAPELLEALRALLPWNDPNIPEVQVARALINRIERDTK